MGIQVVRFRDSQGIRWGTVAGDEIHVIPGGYPTLADMLASRGQVTWSGDETVKRTDVTWLSPVTVPSRIVCQGANYSSHRAEAGFEPQRPDFNLIFMKADSSLTGAESEIVRPEGVRLLDYEVEVGLVIKSPLTKRTVVTAENFLEYVAGIVIANDVSARDVQLLEGQWLKGKSFRTFCPTGPYLYLFDEGEAAVVHNLELKLFVNGELRQSAHTSQLLFKPEETLTELSGVMDLAPGDLILTGTPGGVALNLKPDELSVLSNSTVAYAEKEGVLLSSQSKRTQYLSAGDEVVCEVKTLDGRVDLGVQRNRVV
ncbi:fumarylacetoacetate hydrolase family protein [Alicyclobacillus sp. ALC3]|uniref:fumarylacetoacetate hydrolase family protein n=1 Tax=Alicyclobacillus sp. ALC3 TaxID=2796143 RepID=UPI00237947C1|nr:fumarylacetoacetate hydrolase family protein [Alicyclobacillus sp. ALC3]WDL95499.1 fumarylacetoacetate hydrolase family protein [Alicyclobacillus sp. ALC3]